MFRNVYLVLLAAPLLAQTELREWAAPLYWAEDVGVKAEGSRQAAITGQLPLVGVTPCRVMDTRPEYAQFGFGGAFGAPAISGGIAREVPIPLSSCGIPANARAYSLNFTVVPIGPLQYLTAWPTGQVRPNVSVLNSFDGKVVSNAALVPAGLNGSISVFVTETAHVILDINGYYTDLPVSVAGPPGPTGAAGAMGATGPAGPMGPIGVTGPVGLPGPTGAAGPVGATGAIGPAGATGLTGAAGPTGATGVAGPVGATGATGPAGLTGATGPIGPQGLVGATGPTGATGAAGVSGWQRLTATQTLPAGTFILRQLACPTGKKVLSGGYQLSLSSNLSGNDRIKIIAHESYPDTDSTWTFGISNTSAVSADYILHIICATAP